ncbi:MAG: lipoyl synthase, partial [Propionibacterium sp.]|nr:lipoyl synthase [Propionibacterium sp.]
MTAVKPDGRKLLRVEARNAETPIERKPEWIRTTAKMGPNYHDLKNIVSTGKLNTVCAEAGCPNIYECWEDRESTFLIGGDACTRRCDFCQITSAKPEGYDPAEPMRVAASVKQMGLNYATVTGVCRDDLPDEGAWLYAETIRKVHELNPGVGVEMLAPDFSGKPEFLNQLFDARPEVFGHNVETVPRIFK